MTTHLAWLQAEDVTVEVLSLGDVGPDRRRVEKDHCVVVGPVAVEGGFLDVSNVLAKAAAELYGGDTYRDADHMFGRALRNFFFAAIAEHEVTEHNGERCVEHRLGLVGYLAHCVGLTPSDMASVAVVLAEYERDHFDHQNGGGNH